MPGIMCQIQQCLASDTILVCGMSVTVVNSVNNTRDRRHGLESITITIVGFESNIERHNSSVGSRNDTPRGVLSKEKTLVLILIPGTT